MAAAARWRWRQFGNVVAVAAAWSRLQQRDRGGSSGGGSSATARWRWRQLGGSSYAAAVAVAAT